ncbi:hypothetical protein EGX98_05865 [Fusobacterium necrophorum]|uniref:Uncharacterized protein n=2 Tax=Fusobacterium necrophorum TaxID=859 RepID=A0AB73BTX8_9FUSO|nr:hypothetical protein [Fusobacterium necrophorum]AYZ73581.1 hypothetical protein EGX98_05865 [Fusobacterium necrophorum]AZW08417.1 hypothetical protein EO219_01515 [Fusobacterium necrophorum subsp. necrophorum]KDE61373.1 hypothetical protein FUSO3_10270 [Fusobacterium necrophorum BL]KDE67047.1 hypothetical protein FUSO4_03595 [Fusobacterium necrophorum DJ-1]KDE67323.1 hypothetical protein FUSO5_00535 [Fusobacterium necrophorum BFTR-1]
MEKLVISCPHCHKKIKILKKAAKYKCPHCSNICVISSIALFLLVIQNHVQAITQKIKTKYQNAKNTYKYLKMVHKNRKKR